MTRRALILTGPPAAGKNTIAGVFANRRDACAVIDVDLVRWMVLQPHKAPWEGAEGLRQQELGVRNSCMLAHSFAAAEFDVVILDVLSDRTAAIYRRELAGLAPTIVRLLPTLEEIIRRNGARPPRLQPEEIRMLYTQQSVLTDVDYTIDNTELGSEEVAVRLCG